MMNNKEIINKIYNILNREDIDACYLFGSFLTSRFTDESDVDIAIIGDIKLEDRLYLEGVLEKELDRKVDLVRLEDLPNYIQLQVISRNKVVFFKENENTMKALDYVNEWYKNEYPFWLKMQRELGYLVN